MPSRKKRKRDRRKAEATAKQNLPGKSLGGWGNGLPTSLSDLALLRTAIRQDWPISASVQADIIRELQGEAKAIISNGSPNLRRYVAFMRVLLAKAEAEQRADRAPA